MGSKWWRRWPAVFAVVAAVALAACSSRPDPAGPAGGFLRDWQAGRLQAAAGYTNHPDAAKAALTQADSDLPGTRTFRLGTLTVNGDDATAPYDARVDLTGLGVWSYRGTLKLRYFSSRWRVQWTPAAINPALAPNQHLGTDRTLLPRAGILAADGTPLMTSQPVVIVGVVPSAVKDPQAAAAVVSSTVGVDPARFQSLVANSPKDQFTPVITLREAAYQAVKPQLYPVPGLRFQTSTAVLAPTPTFALPILGRVGPATADALKTVGSPYIATDQIGLSGLEMAYQRQLAGQPSGDVVVLDAQGATVRVLHHFPGQAGTPLATTLDQTMQAAAEQALTATSHPAALVAVRASTGAILAAASTPADSSYDRALDGQYPPGSSFKVVTTDALLGKGLTPTTPVPCPPQAVIDGKPYKNFQGEASSGADLRSDFAMSCNTAFVTMAADHLAGSDLTSAAARFGVGASWKLPLPSFSGQIPDPADQAELAADAIGQGRVVVSPLTMALVAAAVDSGAPRSPSLTGPAAAAPAAAPLDPTAVASLRDLMRAVVTSGTGTAANLPGTPVYGKTGTAEFGNANPPATHAWFIGYRGDVAFAVLVDGGGVGGEVAAPIAATFLSHIPS